MTHIKGFLWDYWKGVVAVLVWWLLLASCWLVPAMFSYVYQTIWAGLGAGIAALFVIGYMRFSRPSKDPVTHKRMWVSEWAWLLAQATITVLTIGLAFWLRLINLDAVEYTRALILQYRFSASVFLTVCLLQLWLFWLWTARQVITRRIRARKIAHDAR